MRGVAAVSRQTLTLSATDRGAGRRALRVIFVLETAFKAMQHATHMRFG